MRFTHTDSPAATIVWPSSLVFRRGLPVALLLFAYVVFVPNVNPLPDLSLYDAKRIMQIVLLVVNAVWLIWSLRAPDGPLSTYESIPAGGRRTLGGILLLGCISAGLAPLPHYAYLEVFHFVLLAALVLSVAHLVRTQTLMSDGLLVSIATLSAGLYLISFAVGYVMSHLTPDAGLWPAGYIGFDHVRFFNQYQSWILPLLVLPALIWPTHRRSTKLVLLIPAAMWWMLLFASGGRGILVGSVVAVALVLVVFGRRATEWVKWQGCAAAAGGIAYGILFKMLATTDASILDRDITHSMGRYRYWGRAAELIAENPVFGVGPMHHADFPGGGWGHPHNVVLQWGMEWGLPATLLLMSIVLWGGWAWIRQTRRIVSPAGEEPGDYVRIALTASFAGSATYALFCGVTIMPMSQVMMALVVGWMVGHFLQTRASSVQPAAERVTMVRRPAFVAVLAAAVIIVVAIAARDGLRGEERGKAFIESTENELLYPRYWKQGNIRY